MPDLPLSPYLLSQVRETSRFSLFKPATWVSKPVKGADEIKKDFSDIILPAGLHNNVSSGGRRSHSLRPRLCL